MAIITSPSATASAAASAAESASLQLNMETLSQSSGVRALGESFFEGMEVDMSLTSSPGDGGVHGSKPTLAVDSDVVLGLNLVLIRDYTSVCGGEVGSSGCGCVLPSAVCTIMKHRHHKVTWPSVPSIFLKGSRSGSAYLSPALEVDFVVPNELPALLQSRFSAETWSTKVASFACAQKFGTTVSDAQSNLESAKEIFCTPARTNKRQVSFMSSLATLQKSSSKALKLDPIVPVLEEKLSELAALKGNDDADLAVSDALVLLVDVARRVDNQATAEGARDELMKASSEYVKSELFDVNLMLGALEGEISGLKALIGKRSSELKTDGNLFEIVSIFENWLKSSGVEEAAKLQAPLAQRAWISSVLLPYKSAIENLAPRVSALENGFVGGQGGADADPPQLHRAPRPSVSTTTTPSKQSARDATWERNIEEQLASLSRLAAGAANLGDKGVNFGGQAFANVKEMVAWFELKEGHANLPMSMFQSYPTMLHRVYTIITGGQRDLRDVKVMADMKIRDHCVNALQALGRGGLPLIFKGDSKNPIFTGLDTGGPKARF